MDPILSIHFTDFCNNRCIFCVVDSPNTKEEMTSRELMDKFIRDHKDTEYKVVNLHGGEPTIRKDFIDILGVINENNYKEISIQTNGRKLADPEFARKVFDLNTRLFIVSIHGKDAPTQDMITEIPGSFDEAVQGIKNVKDLGASVRTNTVVSKVNYTQLLDIMKVLHELKVDHINISALHTGGTAYLNFDTVTPTYTEIRPYVKEAVDFVLDKKIVLTLEGFPYCSIPGMEQHMIDWKKKKTKMLYRGIVFDDYEEAMDSNFRLQGRPCIRCDKNKVCGGVYKEYIEKLGWDEIGYPDSKS